MRIGSANIGMESERTYSQMWTRKTYMAIISSKQALEEGTHSLSEGPLFSEKGQDGEITEKEGKGRKDGSYYSRTMEEMGAKANAFRTGNMRFMDSGDAVKQLKDIRQQCLDYLMRILFPDRRRPSFWSQGYSEEGGSQLSGGSFTEGTPGFQETGSEVSYGSPFKRVTTAVFSKQYYFEETEHTSFATEGTVKCADGREISFQLNVEMSRSFQSYYEETYFSKEVSLCDPLVIHLEGNIPELSDQTFLFDIDGDGREDEISRLSGKSGYLALDRNGDGVINDGSELFGTRSGDGFADLAAYDTDGNGFIDEGDPIWDKLKIWVMNEDGKEELISLKDKGIGAIGLANAPTDFAITGAQNEIRGVVRKTGFFLYESGAVGSVQHVDLAKYDQVG